MAKLQTKIILAGNTLSDARKAVSPPKGENKIVILAKPSLTPEGRHLSREGENKKVILAIETSCDETAAAVLEVTIGGKWPEITTLSSIVNSQIKLHSKMGGVVPEVAARAHVKNIRPVVEKALSTSHLPLTAIDYIAVTAGPGLIPSLIVGVEFAKALSLATGKPLIPVNHMLGHLFSPLRPEGSLLGKPQKAAFFPMIALIVSGGHTILVLMENGKKYKVLGQTVDDATGEAFDKVAKLLGLPYPVAGSFAPCAKRKSDSHKFSRPMLHAKNYNFLSPV